MIVTGSCAFATRKCLSKPNCSNLVCDARHDDSPTRGDATLTQVTGIGMIVSVVVIAVVVASEIAVLAAT